MDEILKDPERVGLLTFVLTVLVAGFRKMWVWGYQLVDMTKDRDFWRGIALAAMKVTEKQVGVDPDA